MPQFAQQMRCAAEACTAVMRLERTIADTIAPPDVQDFFGPTLAAVVKGSDARKVQYVPFAGGRKRGLEVLQEMYVAYRDHGKLSACTVPACTLTGDIV